mgnify:CR=1 FL=1
MLRHGRFLYVQTQPVIFVQFIISDLAAKVQTAQFRKAGIGLNAVAPEYNMERETELVKEISRRSFEDGFFD